jgi:excisionase family DNA binding protein
VPRLLTVDQAAAYLGRSKEAIQHMTAARKLPVVRDGRRVFLDVRELDRWIELSKEPAEV